MRRAYLPIERMAVLHLDDTDDEKLFFEWLTTLDPETFKKKKKKVRKKKKKKAEKNKTEARENETNRVACT